MKPKTYWKIQGWDGHNELFNHSIYVGQITNKQLKELLKTLVSKIALSEQEIISSYAKKRTRAYANHLEVQFLEGSKFMYSCGDNPYVTAVAVIEE